MLAPTESIPILVRRWRVEVTFSEVRAHLGVETQRQWSDRAIACTTPALMGLYSLITLWSGIYGATPCAAAWYRKSALIFTDAIAAVRLRLWLGDISDHSPPGRDMRKIPPGPPHAHGRSTLLRGGMRKVERMAWSVAGPLVDEIVERLAATEPTDVLDEDFQGTPPAAHGDSPVVRGDDDVV